MALASADMLTKKEWGPGPRLHLVAVGGEQRLLVGGPALQGGLPLLKLRVLPHHRRCPRLRRQAHMSTNGCNEYNH